MYSPELFAAQSRAHSDAERYRELSPYACIHSANVHCVYFELKSCLRVPCAATIKRNASPRKRINHLWWIIHSGRTCKVWRYSALRNATWQLYQLNTQIYWHIFLKNTQWTYVFQLRSAMMSAHEEHFYICANILFAHIVELQFTVTSLVRSPCHCGHPGSVPNKLWQGIGC